jgi:hypothetical protein
MPYDQEKRTTIHIFHIHRYNTQIDVTDFYIRGTNHD